MFWTCVALLTVAALHLSFAIQAIPRLRGFAVPLRSGTLRSALGAFLFQVLSAPPFVLLLLTDWFIQYVARRFGASADTAIYVALPIGIPALLLPFAVTLVGAYVGFRSGWTTGMGGDPEVALAGDPVAKRVRWLGPASPQRW